MSLTGDTVWRDHVVAGNSSSGKNKPNKAEIRAWARTIEGAANSSTIVKNTLAALQAVTPAAETNGGIVLDDPTPSNNGYYYRSASAWVKGRGFPDTLAVVTLSGDGTAQTGLVDIGVNPADIVEFRATVSTENTGPLTLSIGGEEPRPVVNAAGNALSAGEWTGVVKFFIDDGGNYRLSNDPGSAQASAQSATNAAAEKGYAEEWAQNPEDDPVSVAAGGDDATTFSALHWAKKAEAFAGAVVGATPVATRTLLKALDTASVTTAILKESGREGLFIFFSGDYSAEIAADTQEGIYIKADAVASTAGAWVRVFEDVSPYLFGATGDNATDDASAFQAAIEFAETTKKKLRILADDYKYGTTLAIQNLIRIEGDNQRTTWLNYTGPFSGMTVIPDTSSAGNNTFYELSHFGITTTTGANYGIYMELASGTTEHLSNFHLHHAYIGEFGLRGIYINNLGTTGGFFTSTIGPRCFINNGLRMNTAGDSVKVVENTITGKVNPGLEISLIANARELSILDNNITVLDNALILTNCIGANVERNWFEKKQLGTSDPLYPGDFTGGAGRGYCELIGSHRARFFKNTIQPLHGSNGAVGADYCLRLINSDDAEVDLNEFGTPAIADILIEATCSNVYIGPNNKKIGSSSNTAISVTDNGIGTRGVLKTHTSYNNGWVAHGVGTDVTYIKSRDLTVTLSGRVKSGAVGTSLFTLPIGFRPSRTERFAVYSSDGATQVDAWVSVAGSGSVVIEAGSNVEINLAGISFRAPLV